MILSCPSWTSAVCCCSASHAALLDDESRFLGHTATSNRPLAHVSVSKNKLQDCCVCLTAPLNFRMLSRDCLVASVVSLLDEVNDNVFLLAVPSAACSPPVQ